MEQFSLTVSEKKVPFDFYNFNIPNFISPCIHKGEMAQTNYLFQPAQQSVCSLRISLKGEENNCKQDLIKAKNKWSVDQNKFPYGQTENQWWEYCLAPHSYLALEDSMVQVGLNLFNRFLHIDFNSRVARLIDPGVGNEMLSTTNWFDKTNGELWFASWPIEGTARRILKPMEDTRVTIWKYSLRKKSIKRAWQGDFGDSLHNLSLSPDNNYLILTELGLFFAEKKLIHSKILILNLKTGKEWQLQIPTAGHVEFDPEEKDVCYISCHNIGLVGVNVGISGPGIIKKIRLGENGPKLEGEFSHSDFHRITTHIVFSHRGKNLIGVSGYPDKVFLIDAATMKLYKIIKLEQGEKVDVTDSPHLCSQDSYGIIASKDGEAVVVSGTGFVSAALIEEGEISFSKKINGYDSNSCFTGHVGLSNYLKE
ncbi:hypothetical protein ASZ90_007341 [hydrocarbon metagenome]|uniref:Uncharacterized protein n=1 Tax=hydrocarbon metagenome TaxID=938273 RepID=A0A0W8FPN3_9ZZZZ